VGGRLGPALVLAAPPSELRATSSFTLSEDSECCVPGVWNTPHTWHIANAGKGHLAALKIDYGTCLFKDIGAKQTCCVGGKDAYSERGGEFASVQREK